MELTNEELTFLTPEERSNVRRWVEAVRTSNNNLGRGKILQQLQDLLSPYGYWLRGIAATEVIQRTAYGYINAYEACVEMFPAKAVEALIERNVPVSGVSNKNPFGKWKETFEQFPPPKSGSDAVYAQWAEKVAQNPPRQIRGRISLRQARSAEDLMDDIMKALQRAKRSLPASRINSERFGRKVVEAVMAVFEVEPGKFSPSDVNGKQRIA
jgi:hypothetical protein